MKIKLRKIASNVVVKMTQRFIKVIIKVDDLYVL